MSGLVDLWTSEQAKVRRESGPSDPTTAAADGHVRPASAEEGRWNFTGLTRAWDRVRRLGPQSHGRVCSEASVSMLVEYMSP